MHARRETPLAVPFPLRLLWARVRNWLAHRRAVRIGGRLLVVLLVVAIAQSASRQVRRAEATWGETVPIAFSIEDLPSGAEIDPQDFELIETPSHLLPFDALTELPAEGLATREVRVGDMITERHVTRQRLPSEPGESSPAVRADELIPPGFRTVGMPLDPSMAHLKVGDEVDLVVVRLHLPGAEDDRSTSRLDKPGVVVGHDDATVVLAVPQQIVNDVVAAVARGELVAVLR